MNENKSISIIIGVVTILVALIVVFVQHNTNPTSSTNLINSTNSGNNTSAVNTKIKTSDINTTTNATNTSPTTKDVTSTNPYTLKNIATHNNASSCWTVVNGSVYDVTSWISQHPGGEQAILGMCGIDASSAFNGQHGGQRRPASELASFKIGNLSK